MTDALGGLLMALGDSGYQGDDVLVQDHNCVTCGDRVIVRAEHRCWTAKKLKTQETLLDTVPAP